MASSESIRQRRTRDSKADESSSGRLGDLSEEEATRRASRGWINHFLTALILTPILCLAILIILPSDIEPVEISGLSSPPAFEGPLVSNNILSKAKRLLTDELIGPESVVVDGEHIYTGTADGWVNRIHQGKVHRLVRFGQGPCGGIENEETCGRPLGMRKAKSGHLIVCDAYFGLYQVNVETGDYVPLYLTSTPVNGETSKFINDLDIGPGGKIYFTDSSTKWHRNQFHNILLEGRANGRLLMYDPENGQTEQVMGDLVLANGVQVTPDKSSVLVAESGRARIVKFDLITKEISVWANNLPGLPDNIRYHKQTGTFWVGFAVLRKADKFSAYDYISSRPWLRGQLSKVMSLHTLMAIRKTFDFSDVRAIAIELNSEGAIISSIQDREGSVIESVSEVESSDDALYFGSYSANFLGKLNRNQLQG